MVWRLVMNPTTRIAAEHRGQTSGSISYTRRSMSAQRLRIAAAAGDDTACWITESSSAPPTKLAWSRLRFPLAASE